MEVRCNKWNKYISCFNTTVLGTNSVINYLGTAQNVAIVNYGDLLLSGSGNKTFAGVTTIAGDLVIRHGSCCYLIIQDQVQGL
jgi:hypothetical protein